MVGERRNGNLLVQLGPKLQAYPEELIRQRRTHDGQTEYLIRWSLGSTSGESKSESILMWMSTEDVYANCPTLLGKRKADSQRPLLEEEERPSGQFPADVTFDEGELLDMKDDVKNLVRRAQKQMAKNSDFRISITHTIHVLSAYASIGSLVGVFKETGTGALDLLMELLCNKERQTRRSAGKMLRALASHDAGSRAYVLLSLSQQDGIEQHMDFENRYTLLELFAETTSSEEHGISFEGIHLPQIPGKLLFSLVKRYLCVTSLMDKLNTAGVEPTSERQDVGPSSSTAAYQSEHARVQREFEFTMAMANLISELVRVMGWDRNRQPPHTSSSASRGVEEINNEIQKHPVRSIFQPRFSASSPVMAATAIAAAVTPPKKKKTTNGFKTRSDFTSRSAYVEFVQDNLKSGMVVRMLEDYEEVSAGDEGEFRYSNDGSPPVQVYWNSLSRTYWVHWHMIEILGNGSGGQAEKETQEKASSLTETLKLTTVSQTFFSKPPGGLYTLPYLMEGSQDDAGTLSRAEWWEVLFFIKKLEPKQQQEINNILRQSLDEPLDEPTLIQLSLTSEVAQKVLHYLKQNLQASCLVDLLCSHTFTKHYLNSSSSSSLSSATASSSSSASSCTMGSVSKKAKKEIPADTGSGGSETESELPTEDDTKYPDDLDEKMKGKPLTVSPLSCRPNVKQCNMVSSLYCKWFQNNFLVFFSDKVLKMLVEMIGSPTKQNAVTVLLLTRSLMLKYEWRVSFATEGGVKAILCCMQEYPTCIQVQQIALATLKVITGASKHDPRSVGGCLPLSESGTQMMLEIFASIGSATPEGSKGLLCAIPSAIDLMLSTAGRGLSVRNGLLVIIMLISSHKSLAEQLVACNVSATLKKCLSAQNQHSMLAIIALNHISMVHKLEKKDNYQEDLLPWHESIEPCLSSMTAFVSDREVVQQFIRFLYRLASLNKDYAVVMCRLGTKEALLKALDKHSTSLLMVTELRDLINDCEKYASLYKKMTTSVLAGCIQMVLGQIEEHRRSHQPINIPFFDVFLRNLCQGSSVELKEDKCWEKVEVSSNHHRANKLTDKNPKTYWESNGCTGSHFINIYMHKGVIIRQLTVLVASEDSSYMPARIVVLGGDDPTNINTELNTVNVAPSASHVVLLENMSRFWPIVQIRVKRCQQGGIDTRVHGFEVLGPKPTFWPVFKEQLCCRTYLFHTTKAHTWCQEILEDKNQLLQLFSKLNSALKHEQMFADRFLPDAEAAEALGRTCWEALITPIVQSITISETSTLSPLSWLMNDYLENADSSKRCKSSASIFNSRVRRLTHLLVHVDTSTVDTEELKPPIKSSDSIAGIALCWQGVVQRQVKSFLDSTCSLPDFVERYRGLFLQLKNAMEELFGQHTAFVLALRQGFSAALLQLSILTAMHVSERFAQYIDKMIQESGVDSGNVDTLNQLQQFLEPMLFLSGLELANTFEHFYRYYLGDRLLGQGKMWLESGVVEQIGTCFPNRFPQQMLTNLSESEELQQEFHLYRLQQLDTNLENFEEVRMIDILSEEVESGQAQKEESDVKVLVLSPRCWVVSAPCYLEEPRKHFPAQLCNYLAEFTEFYANINPHLKPRRLQWTWLGHAELQYGSCTLYVSTLQMYILLQFNKHEDVSVEMLQQATGLSPAMLSHALKPLTAEKGILTHTGSRFLGLNKKTLSQSSDRHGYHFLLPAQTYLNVDEDAALTLERKRNYIYCLIVQIMKNEKEMHIDNLVFKVLDRCQKQEASRTRGSVRFSCSTTDVLSCIMHVINKGYLCRNEESPHIVEFLMEDPSTPRKGQAQFSFKMDVKKSSASGSKAVLFSMGRTMTQEEVKQLMQRTVQQVAGTLSLDLDRAEHLLMHCKWNVDLLIQRYTDDPDALVLAAGLKIRNPQPAPGPVAQCPVCLSQSKESDPPPMLCCMHYCCRSCWQEYLTARIEQNLVMNCDCPITDCRAQPTSKFFHNILTDKDTIAKYDSALLRGFVECCSNLTWCTNPQGCDQVLCKENIGSMGTCSKCCWSSCFSCNFPEAHYPASCSHMSQWMDDGGFYEGMSMEAQSKHLAKLISKRCPSCQAQIEKNEGCLHMTCAKCNHGFCWRCLKPWKPTHKDYYNCSAMVSKAARQEKKFQDYNERCTFHNQAKDFAINLENKVFSINEALQMKSLTFVIDACKILAQARKVLAYSCVYSYYNQDTEKMDVMEQQTEALDLHTNALQILLEETLLQCTDLASCVRLLKPEHLNTGLELIRRIQERLVAILQHSTQDFRVGYQSKTGPDQETSGDSDNNNNYAGEDPGDEAEEDDEYDDEYVPEWHEDYDEEDIDDDDFFSDDDESENLERDFSPFD
uniref:Cullin 7 n=1 Tax=Sinocyclocheilus rhinocerous TaxID=307959 RepID=A0A673M5X8_9TELE